MPSHSIMSMMTEWKVAEKGEVELWLRCKPLVVLHTLVTWCIQNPRSNKPCVDVVL